MTKPRIILADDHELLNDGLRKLLEPDFDVVATVTDGRAAVAAFGHLRPDIVLLDISLPALNGIEAARQIILNHPDARILFVTMQTDRIYVEEAFRAGGRGYVVKQTAASELIEAVRTVLLGRTYVSPRIAPPAWDISAEPASTKFGSHLSARQREVLQLIAEGKAMKDIGEILQISTRTVEFHKNMLVQRLGLHTVAELTRYAVEQKIVSSNGTVAGLDRRPENYSPNTRI